MTANVCYWCGRLTHHDKDYSDRLNRRGEVHDVSPQFGSWLQANTPNMAKKYVVQVSGYEEDVGEGDAPYQSPARTNKASGDEQVQSDIVVDTGLPTADNEEGAGLNGLVQNAETILVVENLDQGVQNTKTVPTAGSFSDQMLLGTGSMGMEGIDPERGNLGFLLDKLGKTTKVTLDQNFQAQLVDIDNELAKFDEVVSDRVDNVVERPSAISSRVVEFPTFLKNLFSHFNSHEQSSMKPKFARIVRKSNVVGKLDEGIVQVLPKRSRLVCDRDSEEEGRCMKKRGSKNLNSMVEADDQPHRHQ